MNLPFLKNRQPQKNFFLALLIKPHKVGAILFEEINDKLFILATNETQTAAEASELTPQQLLSASDKVITAVESSLPAGGALEKTIFSVPYDWTLEGKIKKEYLESLKKICQELGLIPVGYLTSIEAIVHFIEKNEGAPVSAIFLEITKARVYAYLVRAGKILEALSSEVTNDVIGTVEKLLAEVESVDVLPSKIVLADYDGAQRIQQEFLSHKWPKEIPFLHLPQVVVLDRGFENEATVNGVATQMELEVLSDIKVKPEEAAPDEIPEQTDASEFGFVKGADVAEEVQKQNAQEEISNVEEADVSDIDLLSGSKTEDTEGFEEEVTKGEAEEKTSKSLVSVPALSSVFGAVPKIGLPSVSFGGQGLKTKLIAAGLALALFIIAISYLYYNFILHAQVVIFADKKAVDNSEKVTFSQTADSDNTIKLDINSVEVSGEDTKNSTGSKDTGDKAHGSVTVYNKTENKKTFAKGTILVGPNSLEFELLEDVNIASTSSFATSLSSASGKVQAGKFGKEYNLPSGSNFTIKGFSSSDFIAKNSDAISGGTKKTTTVVSKKDLDDLLSQIESSLESEAMSSARQKVGSDIVVFPKSLSSEIEDKSYTKKEGDEAGSVGIKAKIKFDIGQYKKEDMQKLLESWSKSQVPGTFGLLEGDSKTDITDIKISKDGSSAVATLKVHAVYAPRIEKSKLLFAIKGKDKASAEKQIKSIIGVTDVNIAYKNKLPILPLNLPANSKNIEIEIRE